MQYNTILVQFYAWYSCSEDTYTIKNEIELLFLLQFITCCLNSKASAALAAALMDVNTTLDLRECKHVLPITRETNELTAVGAFTEATNTEIFLIFKTKVPST